jgi:hypothetical protein
MSLLEEKIRKNRDGLDGAEPMAGHLERFEARLEALHQASQENKPFRMSRVWKIAAIILVLAGLSVTLYLLNPGRSSGNLAANPLPQEVQEVKMYYQTQADKKLRQIDQCAVSPDQADLIRQIAQQELTQLDSNSVNLENQLRNDRENKRLRQALILNYKTRADLIEDIINKVCKI